MATRLNSCSSSSSHSSSTTFTPSSLKKQAHLSSRSIFVPRKPHSFARGFEIRPRTSVRKHFRLKSSNGHLLNAVSSQDGTAGSPLVKKHIEPQEQVGSLPFSRSENVGSHLSITVVGASGDLARKKIFPALFALYYEDWLPENFTVVGYARTKMTDEELGNMISKTLTCRIDQRANCNDKMDQFLKRCFYHSGQYNSEEHFAELNSKLEEKEVMFLLLRLDVDPFSFYILSVCINCKLNSTECLGKIDHTECKLIEKYGLAADDFAIVYQSPTRREQAR